MTDLDQDLQQRLKTLRAEGLMRVLRRIDSAQGPIVTVQGRELINLSSNDYLGLSQDERLKEAARVALDQFGVGSGASRLICGSLAPHHQLEETLADWKGAEAALVFSSGYAAAWGTLTALLEKGDIVILDKLAHACLVDAARQSGARLRVYAHNDLNDLERKLQWADAQRQGGEGRRPRAIVVTESVFSMDGDLAPLRDLVELKHRYGAWLFVDEAHATGLFGAGRRGLAEAFEVSDQVEIQMGTLGKALGVSGGYICGSRRLIDFLIHRARSFMFSTAPAPCVSAAARAAVEVVRGAEGEERRTRLWLLLDGLKSGLIESGQRLAAVRSPIIPWLLGEESRAVACSDALRDAGLLIPAIRYPTVARGTARLRITMTAAHQRTHLQSFLAALTSLRTGNSVLNPEHA